MLLGGVEPVVTEPRDELAAADVIDSGGDAEFSAFATSRWPGLVRLTWLDASGGVIAGTAALPRYGFVQFQP